RRHTRSYGDWSSDVCSSDLPKPLLRLHKALSLQAQTRHRCLNIGLAASTCHLLRQLATHWLQNESPFTAYKVSRNPQTSRSPSRSEERRVGKECKSWWATYV